LCIFFALVVVQLLVAIEVHSAHVKKGLFSMAHHRTRLWKKDRGNVIYRLYISSLQKNVFRFRGIVIFFRCINSTQINRIFQISKLNACLVVSKMFLNI